MNHPLPSQNRKILVAILSCGMLVAVVQPLESADGQVAANKLKTIQGVPPRDPSTKKNLIDLSDHLNGSLREGWLPSSSFGSTSEKAIPIPLGVGKFGDVDFDVRGVVQLSGQRMKKEGGEFPEAARHIKMGLKCQRLYFLHASAWASIVDKGTQIGVFLVHYTDGTEREIPLAVGEDVGGWAEFSDSDYPNATRVWKGNSPGGSRASIFKSEWRNPQPESEIKSLDYVSKMTEAAPFLIAITAE